MSTTRWPRSRPAPARMHEATEATPEMAAYFLEALRDQSSRASEFERRIRWKRLRQALATEEALLGDEHVIELQAHRDWVRPTAELPAPRRAAAG